MYLKALHMYNDSIFHFSESKYVSGSNRPHVLWNQRGQMLIRKHIESYLKIYLKLGVTDYVNIDA